MSDNQTATSPSDVPARDEHKRLTMVDRFMTYFEMKERGELDKPKPKPIRVPSHLFMSNAQDVERPSLEAIEEFLGCSLEPAGINPIVAFVKPYQDTEGGKTYLVYSNNPEDRQPGVSYIISKQEQLEALENDLGKRFPGFYVKPGLVAYPSEDGQFLETQSGTIMLWNGGKLEETRVRRYY